MLFPLIKFGELQIDLTGISIYFKLLADFIWKYLYAFHSSFQKLQQLFHD